MIQLAITHHKRHESRTNTAASRSRLIDSASVNIGNRSRNALQSSSFFGHASQRGVRNSHHLLDRSKVSIGPGGVPQAGGGNFVQVLDDEGNDVTPLSLLPHRGGGDRHRGGGQGVLSSSEVQGNQPSVTTAARETVADVLNNLESMTVGSWNTSVFGKSMMSYSTASKASGTSSPEGERDEDASSVSSVDELEDRDEAGGAGEFFQCDFGACRRAGFAKARSA